MKRREAHMSNLPSCAVRKGSKAWWLETSFRGRNSSIVILQEYALVIINLASNLEIYTNSFNVDYALQISVLLSGMWQAVRQGTWSCEFMWKIFIYATLVNSEQATKSSSATQLVYFQVAHRGSSNIDPSRQSHTVKFQDTRLHSQNTAFQVRSYFSRVTFCLFVYSKVSVS